jgi:hypothetical protein
MCMMPMAPAETDAAPSVLFRSDTLLVRAYLGRGNDVCFVAFDSIVDDPSRLDRVAFGESFFATYGLDAVHVLSARNNWYQDVGLPDALAAIRRATRGHGRIVTYGSSMGGYAALRFSAAVGAQAAIAISPQYSMLPAVVPFETRWSRERRLATWLHERPGDRLPAVAEALVFHDAHGLDSLHAAAILRDLPNARIVAMRHAGHPAGTMLAELGLLASTVVGAAAAMPDTVVLLDSIRRQRRRSGQYLFTLARRQPGHRLRLKATLAQKAAEASPADATYVTYAGLVAECLGQDREALALHEAATSRPGNGLGELRLAHGLVRLGATREASLAAGRARALMPHLNETIEFVAVLRALHGEPREALAILATSPRFARRADIVRLIRVIEGSPLPRTALGRAIGRSIARSYLRRTVLRAHHPRRELALADASA